MITQKIKLWNIQVSIIPVAKKKMFLIDFKTFKRISLNCFNVHENIPPLK